MITIACPVTFRVWCLPECTGTGRGLIFVRTDVYIAVCTWSNDLNACIHRICACAQLPYGSTLPLWCALSWSLVIAYSWALVTAEVPPPPHVSSRPLHSTLEQPTSNLKGTERKMVIEWKGKRKWERERASLHSCGHWEFFSHLLNADMCFLCSWPAIKTEENQLI